MPIRYECPQCGNVFYGSDQSAGKEMECPACGLEGKIPQLTAETYRDEPLIPPRVPGACRSAAGQEGTRRPPALARVPRRGYS